MTHDFFFAVIKNPLKLTLVIGVKLTLQKNEFLKNDPLVVMRVYCWNL